MSFLDQTPLFNEDNALKFAQNFFGIQGKATQLPSERDQNFHIQTETGEQFVLKIANAKENMAFLEAQNQAVTHLARHQVTCPQVVKSKSGDWITTVQSTAGTKHFVRLMTYLPGIPYGEVRRHSCELFSNLGRYMGQLDLALANFDHPAIHRQFHWDLANAPQVVHQYKSLIKDPKLQALVDKFTLDFQQDILPRLPNLRRSVIHNDANDYNVIVGGGDDPYSRNQQVVGIIDFGDMLHSYTVADLAVAIAYAILDKTDPLKIATSIVQNYHAENPLTADEIAVIFGLVCMRLCISVCLAAYQGQQRPADDYLLISQQSIRTTLPKLAHIHPRFAEATFRQACGFDPVPQAERVIAWLRGNVEMLAPVLDTKMNRRSSIGFDLSIGSPLLRCDQTSQAEVTQRLFSQIKAAGVRVGVGRYNEARLLCTSPVSVTGDSLTNEGRTVHIGMDLFVEPGTPVFAPLEGSVYAISNNNVPQDHRPVTLLQHHTGDGEVFFTLYRYLSADSLAGLRVGQVISRGGKIGTIGSVDVNGGWTPHLHFQIITDLLGLGCDFPGLCRASQRQIWARFSLDPNLILQIPVDILPPQQPSKTDTLKTRRKYIGRNLSLGYRVPLKIERGWMQYLYDETGRKFVDAYNNVPHVGHCHPRVVAAGQQQIAVLNTNTRYLHDFINQYAERLCATLPEPLQVCYFINSGSEANELALRLARAYTRQRDMIVMEAAYHGNTTSLIDISPYKHNGPGGGGAPDWVHTIPIPDLYRGQYKAGDPRATGKYAQHVQKTIDLLNHKNIGLAGFIAETCPSVGGQIILPEGYLAQVYEYVRAAGGLCIADEVQTGYGRIGTHFYAFEAHDVVPDILVLGKPIGNGHPLGAVVTTPEIAAAFDNGMEFFSTFGGNPVSCTIGMTVLDVVIEEGLQRHALEVGNHLLAGLRNFKECYPIVGDVRGSGLFLGVEMVRDPESLEPATEEAAFIANRMRELGILLGTDGPYHNVIKIRPPMPFSKSDADLLIAALDRIFWEDLSN